jgi:RNA polymerase sigma-70 factor (ECF subfamily)
MQADAQLVAAIAAGDRGAFALLFGRMAPRVKAWLMGRGAHETQADEVAQEVMLAVWHQAARYDPARAAVSTWIFTIARNRWVDRVRKERRPTVLPEDVLGPDAASADPTPDAALGAARDVHRVRAAVAALPPDQAAIVRATWLEGRSQRAFAEDHGLALGTVKSRTRLAMKKLTAALATEEGEP